jgi:two-component system phosphate regulon sensor histidine kinase PhoR
VELVWFLLGLLVGLVLLGWHHMQLNFRLRRLIQALKPDALNWSLSSSTARLTRAIASYVQEQEERSKELEDWRQLSQISPTGFLWVDEDNQPKP